jgi:hypothetical protein
VDPAPAPLSYESMTIGSAARRALGSLGDEIRRAGPAGWCRPMMTGQPVERALLDAYLPRSGVDALLDSGLGVVEDTRINLAVTILEAGPVLAVIPKQPWGPDVVYLGPDSAHLVTAVLRLAPHGDRAAELGTGTGLLAALLASRYRATVATDVAPTVAAAADLTLALNRVPTGHAVAVCRTDVAAGLRPESFDLVAANAPWVPSAPRVDAAPPELFAYGGETGIELPRRFVLEGARLLRPGGVGITLAVDVELASEAEQRSWHPLWAVTDELSSAGFLVRVLPTPFNQERRHLAEILRHRQPLIRSAIHVAVIVVRPRHEGDERRSLMVAVDALAERWKAN